MSNLSKAQSALRVLTHAELNDLIPFYKQLLKLNRRQESYDAMASLMPGDTVKLKNIRPEYMNGSIGKVIRLKHTKVLVEFPGTKWALGVNVSASCLEKVAKQTKQKPQSIAQLRKEMREAEAANCWHEAAAIEDQIKALKKKGARRG